MAAVAAADTGEAAVEVAAVEEFADDLRDDRAQGTEAGLVVVWIDFDEGGEVAVGALPEGRAARVAGAVKLHGGNLPPPLDRRWTRPQLLESVILVRLRLGSPPLLQRML